ncbi:MAG: CHASE domain-containing protein [Planctomycetes bacterium]|nr:CHASE domain-containing protein [Planctomycetota bacterium]
MAEQPTQFSTAHPWRSVTAWAVFVLSLVVTFWGWRLAASVEADETHNRFDREVERATTSVEHKLHEYVSLLQGARGLFAASNSVGRGSWGQYVRNMALDREHRGIAALSFVSAVRRDSVTRFLEAARADDAPDFAIRPSGERDTYFVVKYAEPADRNRAAIGFDAGTSPAARSALERARDSDAVTNSGKLRLIQDSEDQPAFVLYIPVYRNGVPHETVEQRRAAIEGWIAAPFRSSEFFSDVFHEFLSSANIEVFDGLRSNEENRVFTNVDAALSAPSTDRGFSATTVVTVGDRACTIHLTPNSAFFAAQTREPSWIVLVAGLVLSLLLSGIVWSLATSRARAAALAGEMTQTLRESETRFRSLSASAPVGIFETDAAGSAVYFNARWLQFAGLTSDEALGSNWVQAVHPDDREAVTRTWRDLARAGESFDGEFRMKTPSGDVRWVHSRSSALRSDAGEVIGHVGTTEDVTERRRNEERMLGLVRAIEASADAIYITDLNGNVQYVNPAFTRITGRSSDEVLGQQCGMFRLVEPTHPSYVALSEAIRRREVFSGRLVVPPGCDDSASRVVVSNDGSGLPPGAFWAHFTMSPIKDDAGAALGFVVVERDVTEEVRREERQSVEQARAATRATVAKLLQEQRPLQDRVRDALEVILATGTLGIAKRAAVFVRSPGGRLDLLAEVGSVPHHFLLEGHPFQTARPRQRGDALLQEISIIDSCSCGGQAATGDDGDHGHVYAPLLHRGELVGGLLLYTPPNSAPESGELDSIRAKCELIGLAIANDRMQMEIQRARESAEEATRTKSEFLANMSHEIRTPMTAIVGYTDLLLEPGRTDVEREEFIRTIQRNGAHLMSILNDILDLSKIEACKLTCERVRFSPRAVVSDVASMMRGRALEKHLDFGVQFVGMIPETIESDPTRLRQILLNLVGNALKFTERGGVMILTSLVDIPTAPDPRLSFSVMDTGIGMTREQRERLFRPFTQADNSMTRRFGGTGLGLTISKRFAEMLGGDICVTSTPGRGTTFTATLRTGSLAGVPLVDGAREAMIYQAESKPVARPKAVKLQGRILLAEDGVDNQRLISLHLRQGGATVEVAENGRVAIEKIVAAKRDGAPFDCILMDMQMPEVDGYTAATRLRQMGHDGPIIALTAHATEGDRAKCLAAGCDDYVSKPIDRARLFAAVDNALRRSRGPRATEAAATPTRGPDSVGSTDASTLQSTFDSDVTMADIIAHFTAELPDRVAAMIAAAAARNLERLAILAHQMKGAAGGYGFPSIGEKAAEIETLAKAAADGDAIRHSIEDFASLCSRVRPAFGDDVPVA